MEHMSGQDDDKLDFGSDAGTVPTGTDNKLDFGPDTAEGSGKAIIGPNEEKLRQYRRAELLHLIGLLRMEPDLAKEMRMVLANQVKYEKGPQEDPFSVRTRVERTTVVFRDRLNSDPRPMTALDEVLEKQGKDKPVTLDITACRTMAPEWQRWMNRVAELYPKTEVLLGDNPVLRLCFERRKLDALLASLVEPTGLEPDGVPPFVLQQKADRTVFSFADIVNHDFDQAEMDAIELNPQLVIFDLTMCKVIAAKWEQWMNRVAATHKHVEVQLGDMRHHRVAWEGMGLDKLVSRLC